MNSHLNRRDCSAAYQELFVQWSPAGRGDPTDLSELLSNVPLSQSAVLTSYYLLNTIYHIIVGVPYMRRWTLACVLSTISLLGTAQPLLAANVTWNVAGSGDWDTTSSNWTVNPTYTEGDN